MRLWRDIRRFDAWPAAPRARRVDGVLGLLRAVWLLFSGKKKAPGRS